MEKEFIILYVSKDTMEATTKYFTASSAEQLNQLIEKNSPYHRYYVEIEDEKGFPIDERLEEYF